MSDTTTPGQPAQVRGASAPRVLFGGLLMGLANLVPGVSGGTMILAMGLYDRFIGALADVTRLRLRMNSMVFLVMIAVGAGVALVGLSGVAVSLVTDHRWVMYSLFIGMTLGGTPELWKACAPRGPGSIAAFSTAFALMAALAWGMQGAQVPETTATFVFMGVLGASSMILPGISGSYMLLIFGMYDVVIGALSSQALRESPSESAKVLIPVGVGALLGIALLSNLLKHLLARYSVASHSVLLGLLLGSVLGLWPFQEPANPELAHKPFRKSVVMLVEGQDLEVVNERYGADISAERALELRTTYAELGAGDLKMLGDELVRFDPRLVQVASSIGLLLLGFGLTRLLGRQSKSEAQERSA